MKLLAALDFSDVTDNVVTTIQKLAGASSASVILLHVIADDKQDIEFHPTIEPHYRPPQKYYHEPDSSEEGDAVPILHHKNFKKLQNIADLLDEEGIEATLSIVHGNAARTIIEHAEKEQADFILLGSHGHKTLYQLIVGTVCSGVVSDSGIPVIIVPKKAGKKPRAES
jgi:nucleotide-binding universal stress UspA family protein